MFPLTMQVRVIFLSDVKEWLGPAAAGWNCRGRDGERGCSSICAPGCPERAPKEAFRGIAVGVNADPRRRRSA